MELSKILMDLYDKAGNGGSGGFSAEERNGVVFMTPTSYDDQTETFGDYVVFDIKCGDEVEAPAPSPKPPATADGAYFSHWRDPSTHSRIDFPFSPTDTQILEAYFRWPA